jgi:hypothetical protein
MSRTFECAFVLVLGALILLAIWVGVGLTR